MRSTDRNERLGAVARISAVLDCFSDSEQPLTLGEVSRGSGLPKTTTWRLVKELIEHGFLEHEGDGLVLGLRFFELGERTRRPRSLRRLTWEHMERLRQRTGHTVHLAVMGDRDVVYIEILPSRTTPRMPSRVGGRVPAHATAVGKALLAFDDADATERVIGEGLEQVGPATIVEPERLRQELRQVRTSGIAVEREESAAGVTCVAAPLLVGDGPAIAALSVSGPCGQVDEAAAAAALRDATQRLRREATRLPAGRRVL